MPEPGREIPVDDSQMDQRPVPGGRPQDPRAMSFGEHLEELRRRLIFGLAMVVPIFILTLVFGDQLLNAVIAPAQEQFRRAQLPQGLQSLAPLETLGAWLKVSAVATVVLGVPALLYQLWLFVAPGLHAHERRFAAFLIPLSVLLSVAGLLFLYFVMLPAMLAFLINFGAGLGKLRTDVVERPPGVVFQSVPVLRGDPADPPPGALWFNSELEELRFNTAAQGQPPALLGTPMMKSTGIAQQYRLSEYIDLLFTMSLAFVAGFQTAVVVLLLGWMGLVDRAMLRRKRKHAIFIAFVVAAVLTPSPDPFSMTVLAVPLYLLYELGMVLLRFAPADRVASGWLGRMRREPADAGGD
jgi:sec-independent protein translocase protein TatC